MNLWAFKQSMRYIFIRTMTKNMIVFLIFFCARFLKVGRESQVAIQEKFFIFYGSLNWHDNYFHRGLRLVEFEQSP